MNVHFRSPQPGCIRSARAVISSPLRGTRTETCSTDFNVISTLSKSRSVPAPHPPPPADHIYKTIRGLVEHDCTAGEDGRDALYARRWPFRPERRLMLSVETKDRHCNLTTDRQRGLRARPECHGRGTQKKIQKTCDTTFFGSQTIIAALLCLSQEQLGLGRTKRLASQDRQYRLSRVTTEDAGSRQSNRQVPII